MSKNFVLDTNVLLHDPRAMVRFADNNVIIPIYVIEEVDSFKKQMSELGRNAREVSRLLDDFRDLGNLGEGVPTPGGGILRVGFAGKVLDNAVLHQHVNDNRILGVALHIKENDPDRPCILVTKDTNLRVRADVLGLDAENYEDDKVSITELYPGACEIVVPAEVIDELHDEGALDLDLSKYIPHRTNDGLEANGGVPMDAFYDNEYALVRSESGPQTTLGRIKKNEDGFVLKPLNRRAREDVWGVRPRNKEQAFAFDALLDDDIALVALLGKAGTGKTLMAIAAGLRKVTDEQKFSKLVVSRPIFPMGRDIGYLPGTMEEKLNPWMRPIFDNVEYLMGLTKADKRAGRGADELINMGIIEIEPLTYIRGRSLPNQYFIVDEAQNLTPHEVKTILTRIGEGSKLILTGDPYQIDNPYIDSESNGLTYVIDRFKGQSIFSSVTLFKGERSALAELAANLL
ncbi:PhoH family protein [Microvenator marinus]|jgi:PhoH-like ATPase|uniref:PhoH family protein n=1 Tax=Microvenator marinus TaxID=2600177 RepID=A0A5B8XVP5_9DELT|nr:PhoH family protein [Microvenator marinus]QED29484.1 PhoH family protein [Microvenator marinus]